MFSKYLEVFKKKLDQVSPAIKYYEEIINVFPLFMQFFENAWFPNFFNRFGQFVSSWGKKWVLLRVLAP